MTDGNTTEGLPGEMPEKSGSETDSLLDKLTATIDARFASYTSKINGELAGLRRKGAATAEPAQAAALTVEDLRLSREIGRMETELGDEVVKALGEDYQSLAPSQQAVMLRAVQAVSAKRNSGGGAMPGSTTPNARAAAAVPREAVVRPRTQTEFAALRKSNPSAFRELVNDPTFDAAILPYR